MKLLINIILSLLFYTVSLGYGRGSPISKDHIDVSIIIFALVLVIVLILFFLIRRK